jgi:hypothetical protein|tara:strand:- start:1557 stop:1814 length:258 start_codon:yes stop_codon:yes gene_type:complete
MSALSPEDREFLEFCYAEWEAGAGHSITSKSAMEALSEQALLDLVTTKVPKAIQLWKSGGFGLICQTIKTSGDPYKEVKVLDLLI